MSIYTTIFSYLKELFPNPDTELDYQTEFQLIVAVILSAQTTDIQVNKVTNKLFKKIKEPQDIVILGEEKLTKSISSVNYYRNKAKYIFKLANILNTTPLQENCSIEELQKLPGVGEKTAKVIAHVLWKKPVIAVDTHVHRVCNRRGIVSTKTPEQTSKLLEKLIPKKYKTIAHHSIILFGRYYCKARNPLCKSCKLQKICAYYSQNK